MDAETLLVYIIGGVVLGAGSGAVYTVVKRSEQFRQKCEKAGGVVVRGRDNRVCVAGNAIIEL